ncbi:lipopolysaccharide heptosyltransferase II [candidate division KSB1 bacterium]|nr:lipopolysaccharide heptosyltransferase II [candidate division KSB1 bacterium]
MPDPHKILVIRLSSIGDILLTTPLLRLLRRRFPQARIDFVVKEGFADLLRCHPAITSLIRFAPRGGLNGLVALRQELRKTNYDLVIDIHKNWRSRFMTLGFPREAVLRYRKYACQRVLLIWAKINCYPAVIPVHRRYLDALKKYGIADDGEGLEMALNPQTQQEMQVWLERNGYRAEEMNIGLAPGAGKTTKRWPAESFARLARLLMRRPDVRIWILGDRDDQTAADQIVRENPARVVDATGRLSLMQSACAIAAMNGLICNDSGLMHLATAVRCPVVAVFGPTTREFGFYPQGERCTVVEHKNLGCRPCSAYGSKRCPRRHFRCMKEIASEQVYEAACRLFESC